MSRFFLLLVVGLLVPGEAQPARASRSLGSIPGGLQLHFVENRGVYPERVGFYVPGSGRTIFFVRDGVVFRFSGARSWTVRVDFVGAKGAAPRGESPTGAVVSYFTGPREQWKTGLRTYRRVVYRDLWPGIDLIYEMAAGGLKYEAVVRPRADAGRMRLRYRGAARIGRTADGGLQVETPCGTIEERVPAAYQDVGGSRRAVPVSFEVVEEGDACQVGFQVGTYDPERPLVIDPPVIVYCGYIGGGGQDEVRDIAVDTWGCAYVTGWTRSHEKTFPVTVGPDLTYNGIGAWTDAFVAKVRADGSGLVYCGFIGGQGDDRGEGVAVDRSGAAYVAGSTMSLENSFPATVGPDTTFNGGIDAFVAKVSPDGTRLEYCGYIGAGVLSNPWLGWDGAHGIAVDATGSAYVVGETTSYRLMGFPVQVGPSLTHQGGWDAFVAKVNPAGTRLVYCGYIGGRQYDTATAVAVDTAGHAFVAGWTTSTESTFPVRIGPDVTSRGATEAFVAKVRADGSALDYCGYIGGTRVDQAQGIAVDGAGRAYVVGRTESTESSFPVTVGPDLTQNDGGLMGDAFVARVNPEGSALEYCGYLGGNSTDWATAVTVDALGRALVCGSTLSMESTFPVRLGPSVHHTGFYADGFVARLGSSGALLEYCGYIGGKGRDNPYGIATNELGNSVFVAGTTTSANLPVTVGPDLTYNSWPSGVDGWVAKVTSTALSLPGAPAIGEAATLYLMDDPKLPYQLGSSLGAGPTPIGVRKVGLSVDRLLLLSISGQMPWIFSGYAGILDAKGRATATIRIPNEPALIGVTVHSAFVTFKASAPEGVYSISNPVQFWIRAP